MRKFLSGIFILLINLLQAQNNEALKEEETFCFSYPVKEVSALSIINKYGNICYSGILSDSVKIEATVKLKNPDDENASDIFGMINITPRLLKKNLQMTTEISGNFSSSDQFTVTYMITGTRNLSLNFNNQFGDIVLNSFSGNADITLDYGNFSANEPFPKLKLKLKNGKTELSEIGIVNAELSNAQFSLGKTTHIEINAEFSSINIEKSGLLNAKGQTSEYMLNKTENLSITGLQCFVKSSVITKSGFFEIQKGSLSVNRILKSTENISVAVVETPVSLGLDSAMDYTLHGEITNGNFEHPEKSRFRLFWDENTLSFGGEVKMNNPNGVQTAIILFSENSDITIKYIE